MDHMSRRAEGPRELRDPAAGQFPVQRARSAAFTRVFESGLDWVLWRCEASLCLPVMPYLRAILAVALAALAVAMARTTIMQTTYKSKGSEFAGYVYITPNDAKPGITDVCPNKYLTQWGCKVYYGRNLVSHYYGAIFSFTPLTTCRFRVVLDDDGNDRIDLWSASCTGEYPAGRSCAFRAPPDADDKLVTSLSTPCYNFELLFT